MAVLVAMGIVLALSLGSRLARPDGRKHTQSAWDSVAARPAPVSLEGGGFIDSFRGIDEARWRISDGWSNGGWTSTEWRAPQTAATADGVTLTLASAPEGAEKPYVSGEIATRAAFVQGYYESRVQVPRGEGLVAAFFTFARPDGRRSWNEIDVEILGRDTRRAELTYHVAGRPYHRIVALPFDAADGFHTYAFEWRAESVRWYADNVLLYEMRSGAVGQLTRPQNVILQLWNSEQLENWVGEIEPAEAPWTMTVACVAQAPRYQGRSLCADRR